MAVCKYRISKMEMNDRSDGNLGQLYIISLFFSPTGRVMWLAPLV